MKQYQSIFNKLESLHVYAVQGEYCEPGYRSDKPMGVLFGDWNPLHKPEYKGFFKALEEMFNLDWSDEYTSCEDCGKYFRTTGDCYQWTMYGWIHDSSCLCGDCVKENPDDYIKHLKNNNSMCCMDFLNLESMGWENLNGTFANGFFEHMHDDPKSIMQEYQKQYPNMDIVFGKLEASQFYIQWQVYGKEKENE
jgi:hypothetical protein